jgi:hypothetical protein
MNDKEKLHLAGQLMFYMKNDSNAVDFCVRLMELVQVWDDLIDRDKAVSGQQINDAFLTALVEIPLNPFYRENVSALAPVVLSAYLQWKAANAMEAGLEVADLEKSFMLRASVLQVWLFSCFLVGGDEWADKVGPDIMRLYSERFNTYLKEITKCQIPQPV